MSVFFESLERIVAGESALFAEVLEIDPESASFEIGDSEQEDSLRPKKLETEQNMDEDWAETDTTFNDKINNKLNVRKTSDLCLTSFFHSL